MNLDPMPSLTHGEPLFWIIAAPVMVGTVLIMR